MTGVFILFILNGGIMNNIYELDRNRYIRRIIIPGILLTIVFLGVNYIIINSGMSMDSDLKGNIFGIQNIDFRMLTGALTFAVPAIVTTIGIIKDYFSKKLEKEIVMPKKSKGFALSKMNLSIQTIITGILLLITEYVIYSVMGLIMESKSFIGRNDVLGEILEVFVNILPNVVPVSLLMIALAIFISATFRLKSEEGMPRIAAIILTILILIIIGIILVIINYLGIKGVYSKLIPLIPNYLPIHSIIFSLLIYPILLLALPKTKYIKREVLEKINDRYEIMSRERAVKRGLVEDISKNDESNSNTDNLDNNNLFENSTIENREKPKVIFKTHDIKTSDNIKIVKDLKKALEDQNKRNENNNE